MRGPRGRSPYGTAVDDLVRRAGGGARVGAVAGWVVPHRAWEARRWWRQLRSGGCSARRSMAIALSGRRTNAMVNTRLDLLPGRALDHVGVVADVGANVGDWTAGLLAVAEPRRVFAFEPSPEVFPALGGRFGGRAEVTLVNAAAGEVDGTTPFHLTAHPHNSSVLRPRADAQGLIDHGGDLRRLVDVAMVRLDTALASVESLDILKVDVQGFERSVLAGAHDLLRRTTWVLVEANFVSLYDGDLLLADLHQLMLAEGFSLANLSQPYVRDGTALFSDALYRRG